MNILNHSQTQNLERLIKDVPYITANEKLWCRTKTARLNRADEMKHRGTTIKVLASVYVQYATPNGSQFAMATLSRQWKLYFQTQGESYEATINASDIGGVRCLLE